MITPRWIIHPTVDELQAVCRFLAVSRPDEANREGVWVLREGMQRVWSGETNGVMWQVDGGMSLDENEPMFLPARVIWEAQLVATEESGAATILVPIDEDVAIVEAVSTSTVIDLLRPLRPAPSVPQRESAAIATTTAGALADLMARARFVPNTAASEEFPDPVLTVVDGTVAIHTDWSVRGACRTTYRLAATTDGSATVVPRLRDLHESLRLADRETEVEIDIPVDFHEPIILREPGAWSTYACTPTDARRHHPEVFDALIDLFGEGTNVIEYGSFGFEFVDRPFTVQLLDGPDAFVRIATPVYLALEHERHDEEFLRQLVEMNSGLVAARLWIDGPQVWGAIDLPISAIAAIPWAIDKLHSQFEGFDVFLSAVVGEVTR